MKSTERARGTWVGLASLVSLFLLPALSAVACGGVTIASQDPADSSPSQDGGVDATLPHDASADSPSISFEDTSPPPFDAAEPDVAIPEAGPIVVSTCSDAAQPCALPPSVCLDARDLEYYTTDGCSDAGTCSFEPHIQRCNPSGTPPDCFQGGCRITIVR